MKLTKKEILDPRTQEVYKRALRFRKDIYAVVKEFPIIEKFNMIDQLRRASTSIPANFSEGYRNHYYGKERDRLNTALGSTAEIQAFLDMAIMEKYISRKLYEKLDAEAEAIFGMLIGMIHEIDTVLERA